MKRFRVRGGFFSDVDDMASEKSGPAEGVGFGAKPRGERISTITFNIDMHVDIHLNIDCQFGITESMLMCISTFIVTWVLKKIFPTSVVL
jgi:hypothetical protein